MKAKTLILGAGFGGMELATLLSEEFGANAGVVLIDRAETFAPGSANLDLLLGRFSLEQLQTPYRQFEKPGVTVLREEVRAIDPASRKVTTDAGSHEADFLVIALGAGYDLEATPGFAAHAHNLYTAEGAAAAATDLERFERGSIVIGVCGAPVKCPPAPSAAALLIADALERRGVRGNCGITLAMPAPAPVPPSPEASAALLDEFETAGITYLPGRGVSAVEPGQVRLSDGSALPFEFFLGVPQHRVPEAVRNCGLAADGYVAVDTSTLETDAENVWALGDVAATEAPRAGVFAEDGARTVAATITARTRGAGGTVSFAGRGSCYMELGQGRVSRIDVETYPAAVDRFVPPAPQLAEERQAFGRDRRRRWFGA